MAAVGVAYAAASAAQVATVVSTAVSVASTIAATAQARAAARAQEVAAERRNAQLVEQTISNYDELAEQELDAQQQSLDRSVKAQRDFLVNKGRINAVSAARGVGGLSVSSQLQDLERVKYSNYNTILLDRQAQMDNIADQAQSMRYQAASQMDVRPISRPSWAAAALDVGAGVTSGYTNFRNQATDASKLQRVSSTISAGG